MNFDSLNINCDLGEGAKNDALIMPYIHACNIACSGHYGDASTIKTAIHLAQQNNVKIGAHPSYPDKDSFGRKIMPISHLELKKSLTDQLELFFETAALENESVNHIKLHGALYNATAKDRDLAKTVVSAFKALNLSVALFVPPNSAIAAVAHGDFDLIYEAFIDRTYQPDGSLTRRSEKGALIASPEAAWEQLETLYLQQQVKTVNGTYISLKANTFCIHGDSAHALAQLTYIQKKLRS